MAPHPRPTPATGDIPRALWDHLPLGVAVVDAEGTIRMANLRLVKMAGYTAEAHLIGKSAFDFVDTDDLAAFAEGFSRGPDFHDIVLGPLYFRFRDVHQKVHVTECWAYDVPPGLGFEGYVITLAAESTTDLLAAATRGIAAGNELEVSLAAIAGALHAYPVNGAGSILVADNGAITGVAGEWPFPNQRVMRHPYSPWVAVAEGAPGGVWAVDELPHAIADEARRRGLGAVWVRPIDADHRRRGVLVTWRTSGVAPSPNQLTHIGEAATAASLAFAQHDHRRRLQRAAFEDHLTGVGNRAGLGARSRTATGGPCGVLFIDLDYFKQVNDLHGHYVGDRVLRMAAERLTHVAGPHDEVYRVGGDEFVIVCDAGTDSDAARTLAEQMASRVIEVIGEPFDLGCMRVTIGASVGVAITDHEIGLADVLSRADDALLEAKRAGRGRWSALPLAKCR
jgi:diguanylate cyclase (GGDEF)-like protein